jgi:cation diffusion facilitator family transporter
MQSAQQNIRLQLIIVTIAIFLFVLKIVAWWLTKSVAILSDALESIVNIVAGLIGLYSLYVAAKPKDIDHPYGHGKVEFISAAIEGTLIIVAGVIIIYKAVLNFIHPQPIHKVDYGIVLIAITAFINYIAGLICVKTGKQNNSLVLVASGKHLQSDTWSTIGVVISLVLIYFFKYSWIDSVVAIIMALFIIYTGYKIIRSSIAGIMDEADEALLQQMVNKLNANRKDNWIDLHNLRIIKYGSTLHIDCHLTVPWYLNVHEAHKEIDALSTLVKNEFGESIELFVHSDGCLDFSCAICTKQDCTVRKNPFTKKLEWTMENISSNNKHRV